MRPTKLTEKLTKTICTSIRAGNYAETAAQLAGVNSSTTRRWLSTGRAALDRRDAGGRLSQKEIPLAAFTEAVDRARAESEARILKILTDAGEGRSDGNWQAAAWLLERMYPARWGKKDCTTVRIQNEVSASMDSLLDAVERVCDAAENDGANPREIYARILDVLASDPPPALEAGDGDAVREEDDAWTTSTERKKRGTRPKLKVRVEVPQ